MEYNENYFDDDPPSSTVEDILSSVLKVSTNSKLHGRLRGKRSKDKVGSQHKDESQHKEVHFEKDLSIGSVSNLLSNRGDHCDFKAKLGSMSSSKMTRSVSTPEIPTRFHCYSSQTPLKSVIRNFDFNENTSNKENLCHDTAKEPPMELSKTPFRVSSYSTSDAKVLKSEQTFHQKYSALLLNSRNAKRNTQNYDKKNLSSIKPFPWSSMSLRCKSRNNKEENTEEFNSDTLNLFKNKDSSDSSYVRQSLLASKKYVTRPLIAKNLSSALTKDRTSELNLSSSTESDKKSLSLRLTDSFSSLHSSQSHLENENSEKSNCFENSLSSSLLKPVPLDESTETKSKASEDSQSLHLDNSDMLCVKGESYFKLGILGKGGSSVVYKVLDLQSKSVKAVKVVSLKDEDESSLESYKNEIKLLEKLQYSPRIIKIYSYEVTDTELKLVMEAGGIDLATILTNTRKNKTSIPPFTIQHYWQAMLRAVQDIHNEGIIHSDLKPANFILVNDTLKLIDFGIASSIQQDMTSVFKESQAGTFNYMSPESLRDVYSGPIINGAASDKLTIKMGVKSDVWSLGCILYNLVYGRTPFQHITKPLLKLAAISNPTTKISFPQVTDSKVMDVLVKCLQFEPAKRPSIKDLLQHPYLQGVLIEKRLPDKESHGDIKTRGS